MSITVKQLMAQLKKMPQDLTVGYQLHDYDTGDSEEVNTVELIDDSEVDNDSGSADHRVVIGS